MVTDWSEERTVEEDEEQLVMRRLRNSVDDLRRGLRHLTYKVRPTVQSGSDLTARSLIFQMEKVKVKAEKSREHREKIELLEGTISLAGEPTPFRAYVPQGEMIKYGQDSKSGSKAPRLMYKVRVLARFQSPHDLISFQGCKLNNRSLHNFRPIIGKARSYLRFAPQKVSKEQILFDLRTI